MYMAVIRSAGIGLIYMLVVSLLIGLIGIPASVGIMLFCVLSSYLLTGWIAGKEKESPFVIAGISALALYICNVCFTLWFVGIVQPMVVVIALFIALGVSLCGVLIRKRSWSRKGTQEYKQSA